jgi:methylmalonyl-CoA/ethylmalonyl-CoA epimerase
LFRLSPHHTGIIVSDLEANETNSRFSGSGPTFKLRFGYGLMGVSAVELIQPLEGETIYAQYLRERGPGIHHLGFLVRDLAASKQQLESDGCSC